ncbi:three-Cys-motif partner protein TcmP [Amycolatopsis roodepoortensis]|uniref:three-Cys-motif partner protein TcmP n=1 Tax=Amycolatopsis roodepoortensis TaxID=700274 RepID=UPI00214ADE5B|nr:three-Cys-motif partner protein TcmP [Amycolatopsis roodepoortensis]UUV32974.1 three-Cys-motif partner protein TcmP [Amycolatopsis roodepoortensis]
MNFFNERKAAAVFKHALLGSYLTPFAMKTGSASPNNEVAFIDGYAGAGRYEDGSDGSPALVLSTARSLAPRRKLKAYFVEADPQTLAKLNLLVNDRGTGLDVRTFHGEITDHISQLLTLTTNIPTFTFMDPFGLAVPFETIVSLFKRQIGGRTPISEALINFTAVGLRRIAGHLTSATPSEATLCRMDNVCGGNWWREAWLNSLPDREKAELAVVEGYMHRLSKAAGSGGWTTEVRNKRHHKPVYYLVFLSRHFDGLALYGESQSIALDKWRKHLYEVDNDGTLFSSEEDFKAAEVELKEAWISEIQENLQRLLQEKGAFIVGENYADTFGEALGKARTLHLRKAWKNLHAIGLTQTNSMGDILNKKIERTRN